VSMDPPVVRAAGGVVWRTGARGTEVVLVHRPRYDDWSLPKGKLEAGEHPLAAAVREVAEETGVDAVPQVRLPGTSYLTGDPGARKEVDYWSMRARADHGREPDREVSQVRWVPMGEAPKLLTYAHDRGVVHAFARLPLVTTVVVLVRHAKAGSRRAWHGPDELRPLDSVGLAQAEALTPLLALFVPGRVVSASPIRCRETVTALAERLGLAVEVDPVFDEPSPADPAVRRPAAEAAPTVTPPPAEPAPAVTPPAAESAAEAAAEAVRRLALSATTTVVCSQGKLIPPLLRALSPANATASASYETPKGSGWLLAFCGTDVLAADRVDP
jgi:8-oxo-dGTP pyrophosphatase MutT (NUDIX family)